MSGTVAMLLAGGGGTRLGVLVERRSKPAVPFGGRYRIIDMVLSNLMHAAIDWVGVATQYQPLSLMSHIGTGRAWNYQGRGRGLRILPPRTGLAASDWYRGTADAVWQSMDFLRPLRPERVLVVSGDHIYRMNYRLMEQFHLQVGAEVTLAVLEVAAGDCSRFGMVWIDELGMVRHFEEKPDRADTRLASMGIYLFNWECLVDVLQRVVGSGGGTDFGRHVFPELLRRRRVAAYRFDGYWRDVGTVSAYYQANLDILDTAASGLRLDDWQVCTNQQSPGCADAPAAWLGPRAEIEQVRLAAGCRVEGRVSRSVLSTGVRVGRGAVVSDSVLLDGVVVQPGARVTRAVVDKNAVIGRQAVVAGGRGGEAGEPYRRCRLDGLVLVGAGARLPAGVRLEKNVVVHADTPAEDFPAVVPAGSLVGAAAPTAGR